MPSPSHPRLAVVLGILGLAGCRPAIDPDFEAIVSITPVPGSGSPSEEAVALELRARAATLSLAAEIDPNPPGDARIIIRLEAGSREEADAALDALCQSGQLSVRPVHDQTVYFSDLAGRDPSKIPPGYEILPQSVHLGEDSRQADLVVSTTGIIDGTHVERARAAPSGEGFNVLISLSVSGAQQMMAATKKMQRGRSRLAIIYDDRIISAPVVATVLGSDFAIAGFNSFEQAQALAASLNTPLSTALLIESLKPLAPAGSRP
ncbi:MAG: hypothetical protein GWO24_07805 [Akkermansiaceae bacterium]|nr:hypothetical protein [Akkermansiaceae bacterium]